MYFSIHDEAHSFRSKAGKGFADIKKSRDVNSIVPGAFYAFLSSSHPCIGISLPPLTIVPINNIDFTSDFFDPFY